MKKNIGFYAGSFDPFTYGHLNVVTQAAELFDKLIIGIGVNPEKTRRYDKFIMKEAIETVLESYSLENVSVVIYEGLTVETAAKNNATVLVRGLRNSTDYEVEEELASWNMNYSNINTIYFRTGDLRSISSSMVMGELRSGNDVSKYLPKEILEVITKDMN